MADGGLLDSVISIVMTLCFRVKRHEDNDVSEPKKKCYRRNIYLDLLNLCRQTIASARLFLPPKNF